MNAAVTLIHEKGLSHTSTNDIAEAAGVSRGALTHHFESREDLITSAIEHMLASVIVELETFTHEFSQGEASSDELIDFLWKIMSNRLFYVTLEYLPEARHNAMFKERLVPVVSHWHGALDVIWSELALRYGVPADEARSLMNATMCVVRGMIAQTILRDDPPYYARLLEFWKASVRAHLARVSPGRQADKAVESACEAPESLRQRAESSSERPPITLWKHRPSGLKSP